MKLKLDMKMEVAGVGADADGVMCDKVTRLRGEGVRGRGCRRGCKGGAAHRVVGRDHVEWKLRWIY